MRKPLKHLAAALTLCGVVAACSDPLVDSPVPEAPSFAAVEGAAGQQYLLLFKGNKVPGGLAADVAALGGSVVFSHASGIAVVGGLDDAAAGALGGKTYVQVMEADETFDLDPMVGDAEVAEESEVQSPGDPTTAARYPRQWNMRAIGADKAWAAGRLGSSAVTLAILDTGIDYLYVDLQGRVDLSRSASFVPSDDALAAAFFPTRHPVTDLHFHGTHVAATAVSNSLVVAGVTTQTTLIGVKVCSVFGSCSFSSVIAGVLYAADIGADVANMSLGGGFSKAGNGRFVGLINHVFNYARSRGMTIVVSSGNAAADLDHNGNTFATYCDQGAVVCVSATGPVAGAGPNGPWTDVDAFAPYSNFGSSAISVAAPGGVSIANSAGLIWSACSTSSLQIPQCQSGTFILGLTGTSMASPHVAGLASLIVEDVGHNPARVKTRLQQTADDLGKNGTDPLYGKGRINVAKAVGAN